MNPKILIEKPPIFDRAIQVFNLTGTEKLFFAYGDTIYNPNNAPLPYPILVHETTHLNQQKGNPAAWWEEYLLNTKFRIEQEIEAYVAQYEVYCLHDKDRNNRFRYLHLICTMLADPIYGSMLSYREAMVRMRHTLSTTR